MTDRECGRVAKKEFATATIYYPDLQTPALVLTDAWYEDGGVVRRDDVLVA
jgi:hypothetical protein